MKRNQSGFSAILVIGILLVIGAGGIFIWRVKHKTPQRAASNSPTAKETPEQPPATAPTELRPGELLDLKNDYTQVITVADVDKLPAKTPETYKSHLKSQIQSAEPDKYCDTVYTISLISTVNVKGSVSGVEKGTTDSGEHCGGGAAMIWYREDNGSWKEMGFQDYPTCTDVSTKKIYSEFLEQCYDSSADTALDNPLGSIKQLAQ